MKEKSSTASKKWYANKIVIILFLIFFFPIGLFLMWKFSGWAKKTKWIVTGIIALLMVIGLVSTYYSAPSITVLNKKNGIINTDDADYMIQGDIYSMKDATLTINDQPVSISNENTFSHKVSLVEGDNGFSLTATNENGVTTEAITIHRTTQAEFAARAEAERLKAEKEAQENEKNKDDEKQADINETEKQIIQEAESPIEVQANELKESFYINNAYFKGEDKYDVVIYSTSKDTLKIYVNDENSVKAKVNDEGWATFKNVRITEPSKLSFAKNIRWFEYYPINYVKYIEVNGENVTFKDSGPEHTYSEFYAWASEVLKFEVGTLASPNYKTYSVNRWEYISSECDYNSKYDDGEEAIFWDKSCLSDKNKDFINPAAFDYGSTKDNLNTCPLSDANFYSWVCSRYGDLLINMKAVSQDTNESSRDEYRKNAEKIYYEIAKNSY